MFHYSQWAGNIRGFITIYMKLAYSMPWRKSETSEIGRFDWCSWLCQCGR